MSENIASAPAAGRSSSTRFLYDPKVRSIVFQLLFIGLLFFLVSTIVTNTTNNLEQRGITTGFDFLSQEAGFGILQSLVEYDETHTFGKTFIVGLLNTILVSVLGIVLSTVVGFLVGVGRLSRNWLISRLCGVYIEIFRNIPVLLQILFWYIAVLRVLPSPRQSLSLGESVFLNLRGLYFPAPIFEEGSGVIFAALGVAVALIIGLSYWAKRRQVMTGQTFPVFNASLALIVLLPAVAWFVAGQPVSLEMPELKGFNFRGGITVIPELIALLLGLSFYTAAYIAENVRAGIDAINKGQQEASGALGLSESKTMRLVIIPQAMRVVIPPLSTNYMNLIKNSSLATAIGYPELVNVFMGTTLNQTGQAIEIIAMTMAVYLTMNIIVSLFMNWFNNRMALVER
ncbi:amino acid ABC transporter permease [Parendozoicomonas haliclonae]|uniref:Inner membrane amino-acid ABC transporter permease protein YecS n=1 Tax=Parendozoicomonas haliclonae TaxID=1960125 RepID=A0A1X7AJU8_9GAMM|nr:amino acid ABC transporter permease [Parendozoicomonas haliclonae]SMA46330.1 Inner membrane amino-acid ABC transporter permease protein YecS [Parendozoicomonas haliclonae]